MSRTQGLVPQARANLARYAGPDEFSPLAGLPHSSVHPGNGSSTHTIRLCTLSSPL